MDQNNSLETQIKTWLNGKRDYEAGLNLLKRISSNRYVLKKMEQEMRTPGSMFYTEYLSRIIHLLRMFINPRITKYRREKELYIGEALKRSVPIRSIGIRNKKALDEAILRWKNEGRNYNQGLQLLYKVCKKQKVLNDLTATKNTRNQKRLFHELSNFVRQTI